MSGTYDLSSVTNIQNAIKIIDNEFVNVRTETERKKFRDRISELKDLENSMRGATEAVVSGSRKQEERLGILTFLYGRYTDVLVEAMKAQDSGVDLGPRGLAGLSLRGPVSVPDQSIPDTTEKQSASVQLLGQAWQRTGQIMAQSLTRGLGLLNNTNNVMQNIIGSIVEMGLQMAITGAWMGIFSLMTGGAGGFVGGFMKAFGFADGGIVTRPTLALIGEGREAEGVFPLSKLSQYAPKNNQQTNINVTVGGSFEMDGFKMRALINRVEKLEKRYS